MRTIQDFDDATSRGQFFHVKFIKRTTNEVRDMTCRRGVTKHETGVGLSYDPAAKSLMGVYDTAICDGKNGYRQIDLNGLLEVKVAGKTYTFDRDKGEFNAVG